MSVFGRRLRLAMVSWSLPTPTERRGGIERVAHTLADGLASRGHDVTVFTHDCRPDQAAYDVEPLPWNRFVNTWFGRRVTMGYLGNLLVILPDYTEFDAIVMHGDSLLSPLTGKPVLRVMHGSALGEARSATSLGRCILQCGVYAQELLTAMCQSGVVAVSESTTRDNPFVRHVIPLGIDPTLFKPRPALRSTEPSVLFVGSLGGRKRGGFLLDLFLNGVRRVHPGATLTMVGATGPSHPGVTYLTGVDDVRLAELYGRAWVYASPSTYEGFGLPYLEAMASGTPVVATKNPGSWELLGAGAYGVLPADDDFASVLCGLLQDPARRQTLAAAGLERATAYSLSRMLDGYEDFIRWLLEERADSVTSS